MVAPVLRLAEWGVCSRRRRGLRVREGPVGEAGPSRGLVVRGCFGGEVGGDLAGAAGGQGGVGVSARVAAANGVLAAEIAAVGGVSDEVLHDAPLLVAELDITILSPLV